MSSSASKSAADRPADAARPGRRFPPWLTKRIPRGKTAARVRELLAELDLSTVCAGAHCPNLCECFDRGTATFLIMGKTCTRSCRFCAIETRDPGPLRADEPEAVAEATARLELAHVVVTSVTRDDLPDGGAGHFARTIRAVRDRRPETIVEVLVPDFRGDGAAIDTVLAARPDVFNHNVETVPRLYAKVRPQADYERSLAVLARAREATPEPGQEKAVETGPRRRYTKSGLMVGLGERPEEVAAVMRDLADAGCDILTIGQYLAPSDAHVPVEAFVHPDTFDAWRDEGLAMGFKAVASGPFVRSSYMARELFENRRT